MIGDQPSYDMMNNKTDFDTLDGELKKIDGNLSLDLKCEGKKVFDMYQFEEFLKKEFGKILTIK